MDVCNDDERVGMDEFYELESKNVVKNAAVIQRLTDE